MTTTEARNAVLSLFTTIGAVALAGITGDLAVTILSITFGLYRLASAWLKRPISPRLYRARFAVQAWF